MDITFLSEYINIVILGICLCVGYTIKKSLTFIPNKYIPLIMLILGTSISILSNLNNISDKIILQGMFSGLASTGCYEMFRNIIGDKKKKENE